MNQIGLGIHAAMLADRSRNEALAKAIRAVVGPGDIVVDVGAGSGLLAMLAARAGAKRVYALECNVMAEAAKHLVKQNGYAGVIQVIRTMSFNWDPPEQADVVLCETLGFSALEENFRPTMVDARRRMLRKGGILLPNHIAVLAVPVGLEGTVPDLCASDTIFELDFSLLAAAFRKSYQRAYVPYEAELATPSVLFSLDCYQMRDTGILSNQVCFKIARDGMLTGFALWFDACLADGIHMNSRGPDTTNHWGQTYMPLPEKQPVETGTEVIFNLEINDMNSNIQLAWDTALNPVGN